MNALDLKQGPSNQLSSGIEKAGELSTHGQLAPRGEMYWSSWAFFFFSFFFLKGRIFFPLFPIKHKLMFVATEAVQCTCQNRVVQLCLLEEPGNLPRSHKTNYCDIPNS